VTYFAIALIVGFSCYVIHKVYLAWLCYTWSVMLSDHKIISMRRGDLDTDTIEGVLTFFILVDGRWGKLAKNMKNGKEVAPGSTVKGMMLLDAVRSGQDFTDEDLLDVEALMWLTKKYLRAQFKKEVLTAVAWLVPVGLSVLLFVKLSGF